MKHNMSIVMAFFKTHGILEPVLEYPICADRKFRWDMAWPAQRLLVELQGGIWIRGAHGRGSGIKRDYEKLNFATVNGWKTLMYQPSELLKTKTAQEIKWALLR